MPFDSAYSPFLPSNSDGLAFSSAASCDSSSCPSPSSSSSSPASLWAPTLRRHRSPSVPSCARDIYNTSSMHLVSARKSSVVKTSSRADRRSISGPTGSGGQERSSGVVRRRGSTMELELQTSRRRPSTAEAVMEGAESEDGQARSVLSQEVLMDDVDSTLDHDLDSCDIPHSPKPFPTPLQALPPTPTTPFLQPEYRVHTRRAEPETPRTFPLGQPTLSISFSPEEGDDPVPPCFYPGQTIPTTLLFELPRYTTLPHSLNPTLTMSLIGILRCRPSSPDEPVAEDGMVEKNLINVGVSLEEGLKLWAKDAGSAWNSLSEKKKRGRANPAIGLPGGKYTLPLTVQVPTHPRLPPSYSLPESSFQIVYKLEVNLTLDRPTEDLEPMAEPERAHLVQTTRQFTLLSVTIPSASPTLPSLKGLLEVPAPAPVIARSASPLIGLGITAHAGWMDKLHNAFEPIRHSLHGLQIEPRSSSRSSSPSNMEHTHLKSWAILPSLPTSTFSPSSNVPLDFVLRAPSGPRDATLPQGQLLVKASIIRREHSFSSATLPSTEDESHGLIGEEEIIAASGRFDLALLAGSAHNGRIALPRLNLPLGYGENTSPWSSGMTTSLTVSPDPSRPHSPNPVHTHCSSRFYVGLQIAFSPITTDEPTNAFSINQPIFIPSVLKSRSLLIPITIGSVGEPQGARHRRSWRELYLARDEVTGEEAPRMVNGSGIDDERGWMVPPPCYQDALLEKEYIL